MVDKDSGRRVRKANRDLIANHTYVLAENETQAKMLADTYKTQAKIRKLEEKSKKEARKIERLQTKMKRDEQKAASAKVTSPKKAELTKVAPLKKIESTPSSVQVALKKPVIKEEKPKKSEKPAEKKTIKKDVKKEESLTEIESKLDVVTGAFIHSIGQLESAHSYTIHNARGALGKYQFLPDTLKGLGFSDPEIKNFL